MSKTLVLIGHERNSSALLGSFCAALFLGRRATTDVYIHFVILLWIKHVFTQTWYCVCGLLRHRSYIVCWHYCQANRLLIAKNSVTGIQDLGDSVKNETNETKITSGNIYMTIFCQSVGCVLC